MRPDTAKMIDIDILDNHTVVEMLRKGDEACFDALFRRYYKPLCAYATRFVTVDRAEELVQDTLLWVWENREKLMPEMAVRSLIFTIVRNKSLNCVTHNSLRNRIVRKIARQYEEEFESEEFYFESELADRLSAALDKMPPEFSETFRMHRIRGMSHKQIAEALGVSPQTVNYRIGQTVKFLRKELQEYWPAVLLALLAGRPL